MTKTLNKTPGGPPAKTLPNALVSMMPAGMMRMDHAVLKDLEQFIPLAPLQQPHNLTPIRLMLERRPELPQVACFDTDLGSLAAVLGGLAATLFIGGSGENSAEIRNRFCRDAAWLGVAADAAPNQAANQAGGPPVSTVASKAAAWVVPTKDELMNARRTRRVRG